MADDSTDNGELPKRTAGPALHEGLPVAGYRPQSGETVNLVNANKDIEERVLRILDDLAARPDIDKRWLAIGRTQIEQGFMAVNRAVFQPARIDLIEEEASEERGWLIELASTSPDAPLYFAPKEPQSYGRGNWVGDVDLAARFSRHQDAEAMGLYLTGSLSAVRIAEHIWST